jgi:hypothetical protein
LSLKKWLFKHTYLTTLPSSLLKHDCFMTTSKVLKEAYIMTPSRLFEHTYNIALTLKVIQTITLNTIYRPLHHNNYPQYYLHTPT